MKFRLPIIFSVSHYNGLLQWSVFTIASYKYRKDEFCKISFNFYKEHMETQLYSLRSQSLIKALHKKKAYLNVLMATHLKIHHLDRNSIKYIKGQPTDTRNVTQHFPSILKLPNCFSPCFKG